MQFLMVVDVVLIVASVVSHYHTGCDFSLPYWMWFLITILDVVSHYHTGCDFSWLSMWFLITILDVTSHGCPYGFSSAAVAGL